MTNFILTELVRTVDVWMFNK